MYQAVVSRIHTRPLPGADNLVIGTVRGYQVIVQKDTPDGALGLFFEQGGQLSEEFARTNDLVRRKDADGKPAGGFFEENRRVKALKLRGARSDGFWCPLTHVAYTGADLASLKEGDAFDVLNGRSICNKYFTPATAARMAGKGGRTSGKGIDIPTFPRHVETDAFRKAIHTIPSGAIIHISRKLHGTSFRYGHVAIQEPLSGWRRLLAQILRQSTEVTTWKHVNGTRNIVLADGAGEAYRRHATDRITLRKGEVLYGEIVGYDDKGAPIMGPQSTGALKDKAISKRYGDRMVYAYGCAPGTFDLYVYRIVQHGPDGNPVELPWSQVVARCRELGLKYVPHIQTIIYDGDAEALREEVLRLVNGESGMDAIPSAIDPTHIEEGVVLRYESEHGIGFLKEKSYVFGCLEGYLKERDDYVDTEEVA